MNVNEAREKLIEVLEQGTMTVEFDEPDAKHTQPSFYVYHKGQVVAVVTLNELGRINTIALTTNTPQFVLRCLAVYGEAVS